MTEQYPSDSTLNELSGTVDTEQEVLYIPTGQSPYYTSFYKMQSRLVDVARRAGDLRVYKDSGGALAFGVRAGKFLNGDTAVAYAGASNQALTDNASNYIYLTAAGALTVNTSGFPVPSATPHIPLASIATGTASIGAVSGAYAIEDITDYRGRAFLTVVGQSGGASSFGKLSGTLDRAQVGANVAGSGLKQNVDGSLSPQGYVGTIQPPLINPRDIVRLVNVSSGHAAWTTTDGTLADDTANYLTTVGGVGKSITLTMTTASLNTVAVAKSPTLSPVVDLTGKHLMVAFTTFTGDNNYYGLIGVRVRVWEGQHTRYWECYTKWVARSYRVGLNIIALRLGAGKDTSPAPDMTKIDHISFEIINNFEGNPYLPNVSFLGAWSVKARTRPFVVVTFDDVYATQNQALAEAASRGIPVSVFVNTNGVAMEGCLTWPDLRRARDAGHLICNHSTTHPNNWTFLPLSERIVEIETAAHALREQGLGQGARIFASPGGSIDLIDETYLCGTYIDSMRSAYNFPREENALYVPTTRNRMVCLSFWDYAHIFDLGVSAALSLVSANLTATVSEGCGTVELWHSFGTSGFASQAQFATHLDEIAALRDAGTLDVLTMADLTTRTLV